MKRLRLSCSGKHSRGSVFNKLERLDFQLFTYVRNAKPVLLLSILFIQSDIVSRDNLEN